MRNESLLGLRITEQVNVWDVETGTRVRPPSSEGENSPDDEQNEQVSKDEEENKFKKD